MAYDRTLDDRVARIAATWGATRKVMFGGTGYLVSGNMVAGVNGSSLILRLSPEEGTAALARPDVRVFDIPPRPMPGWVMVASEDLTEADLEDWLALARGFVETLPPKEAK